MTNIAESVEREYQKQNELVNNTSDMKSRLKFATVGTALVAVLYPIVLAASHTFSPDSSYVNVDTIEYVRGGIEYMKEGLRHLPIFLPVVFITGMLNPEVSKLANGVMYKPMKLIGSGIDYVTSRHKG